MLQEFIKKYQRKMWSSMISRKNLDLDIWDLIQFNGDKVYYMPYSGLNKFEVQSRHCLKCHLTLPVGFRKNEFIVNTCGCSADSKNYATVQKLTTLFSQDEANHILTTFSKHKTRKFTNNRQFWLAAGFTKEEANKKVSAIQQTRSAKSPASKKGARGFSVRTKEYWIKKGYSDANACQKVAEMQVTNGLSWYIEKYGEVDGTLKYNTRIEKWLNKMSKLTLGISKVSTELFNAVGGKGRYGDDETTVRGKSKTYRIDYYDSETRKIIEFDGDYWHANPALYKATDILRNRPVAEIWEQDQRKMRDLEAAGFTILRISEKDYRENPDEIINKCRKFLNED